MKFAHKKLKHSNLLVWLAYFLVVIFSLVVVMARGSEGIEPIYYMNYGIDLFGMIVIVVIFICCSVDPGTEGPLLRYYRGLINITFLGLFSDLMSWVVNGVPDLRIFNVVTNTLYYMCLPLGCYYFWRYVENMLKVEDRLIKNLDKCLKYGMIIAVLLRIVNIFTGIYFTVDENGIYSRAEFYPISMLYMFAVSAITIILIVYGYKKMEKRQIVILVLYVIAPTSVGVLTMMKYGLSVSYGVITVLMLLMYCIINIELSMKAMAAEREMALAAEIQHSMLPNTFPAFPDKPEIDLYASMDPARDVGGDFYDYFLIDDDHLCIVMADVSGKGVPAALFMMNTMNVIHGFASLGIPPSQVLTKVNESICRNNQAEMFVTVWLGVLELSTGKLTAVNAGHEYPIIKKPDGKFELYKDPHAFVLGGLERVTYKEYETHIEPGTKIFLYTDGLPEATDADNNMYKMERMLEVLNASADLSPEETLNKIRDSVKEFVGLQEPFDDLTMLCLEYTP
ncbi:MAG: serine/threonine-protein phosphatase [Saccharofermentans sp.]|nr:serine/threonine-protein phosphatase [Saccharofermentans sp.]